MRDTNGIAQRVTPTTDRNASRCRVIESRKDWVLELKLHWPRITLLRVGASAVSSQSLLNTVASPPSSVADLDTSRRRQRQEPQRLLIGNADAVKE